MWLKHMELYHKNLILFCPRLRNREAESTKEVHLFLMSMFSFLFLIAGYIPGNTWKKRLNSWQNLKQDPACQKQAFGVTATTRCIDNLFELMPGWASRVCWALCCSDCFIFPFPELFLHCTAKTEGSTLGLIVNRVKQDIEVRPLNPHWASSEWHTWLVELNGGRADRIIRSVDTVRWWKPPAHIGVKLGNTPRTGHANHQLLSTHK